MSQRRRDFLLLCAVVITTLASCAGLIWVARLINGG